MKLITRFTYYDTEQVIKFCFSVSNEDNHHLLLIAMPNGTYASTILW